MKNCFWCIMILSIVGINFSSATLASAEDFVIIANRSVPVGSLSSSDIKDIYLGHKKLWQNGIRVNFVTLGQNDTTKQFLKDHIKMNPNTFKKYWNKKLYTGSGKPPHEFQRQKHLLEFVSQTRGAVGYLTTAFTDDNVKIISVTN